MQSTFYALTSYFALVFGKRDMQFLIICAVSSELYLIITKMYLLN